LQAVSMVAELMALAARTAPKAHGKDFITIKIISGETLSRLADEMVRYGQESGKKNFDRDGENVRRSEAVLLIGLDKPKPVGLNCGACGYPRCGMLEEKEGPEFLGGICSWRLVDLGIALGSAVKVAALLNADNRIFYRAGVAARRMGLIEGHVVVGIPLSATGKNIYFDR